MIEITHYQRIINTPAIPLLIEAWHDLLATGNTDGGIPIAWDDRAFVATIDGRPIGVLSYANGEWQNSFFVKLGYVCHLERRRGVYTDLWGHLVHKAIDEKVRRIDGATHVGNDFAQKTFKSLGRVAVALTFKFDVPL